MENISLSTGIKALDHVLQGVRPGDNIVYEVDNIDDYLPFVHSFCIDANKKNRKLIYFRFAEHKSLLPEEVKADIIQLKPQDGFETFINEIFGTIEKFGKGACYVFDCLSDLAEYWFSDRMLGNFFMLTCPYLFDFETGTYFVIIRDQHSQFTINTIRNTAQVILNVYAKEKKIYLHPLKVWGRYTPTMYMLHLWEGDEFLPLTESSSIAEVISHYAQPWIDFTSKTQDLWSRTFNQAYEFLREIKKTNEFTDGMAPFMGRLVRMILTRNQRVLPLVFKYFNLEDVLKIGRRMIGSGLIGGKALGMLLAQSILRKSDPHWGQRLETHDSFYIGSDVFYTFLVTNKIWWIRHQIRTSDDFKDLAREARSLILRGEFPPDIIEQFKNLLNYYGQSPIIVRSSSLMEDAFTGAFSGKYQSEFLANQGIPDDRLEQFINAVRTVYASSLSEGALMYRKKKGLLDKDEQMAILIQRVSGVSYEHYFYPQLAGVGYSFNPFRWNETIDPEAGILRLVFGLGTRAVDRIDDDYTRIISLNEPLLRPEVEKENIREYTQKKMDYIDLKKNILDTQRFENIIQGNAELPIEIFCSIDDELAEFMEKRGRTDYFPYFLTFHYLLSKTTFVEEMRKLLALLEKSYNYAVDVEFTANFLKNGDYKINIVQCRPFQGKNLDNENGKIETTIDDSTCNVIFKTKGPIIGQGTSVQIDRIVYVSPETYATLTLQDRYSIARLIGKINQTQDEKNGTVNLIIGPGRWGTTTPSLGVPVSFFEINTFSILCEIAEIREDIMPDVSLGTHFFNDLVENEMVYIAIYPKNTGYLFNREIFENMENHLLEIVPEAEKYKNVLKVFDISSKSKSKTKNIFLKANPFNQSAIFYEDLDQNSKCEF